MRPLKTVMARSLSLIKILSVFYIPLQATALQLCVVKGLKIFPFNSKIDIEFKSENFGWIFNFFTLYILKQYSVSERTTNRNPENK